MLIWHEALIPYLPKNELIQLHKTICNFRGEGWGQKNSEVDYIFKYPYMWLVEYHIRVIQALYKKGYIVDPLWLNEKYRGKNCENWKFIPEPCAFYQEYIYPEHNEKCLEQHIEILKKKNIFMNMEG